MHNFTKNGLTGVNVNSWTIDQMLLTNLIPVFVASKLEVYKMAKIFTKTTNHLNFG
jgi:hypothetical protein